MSFRVGDKVRINTPDDDYFGHHNGDCGKIIGKNDLGNYLVEVEGRTSRSKYAPAVAYIEHCLTLIERSTMTLNEEILNLKNGWDEKANHLLERIDVECRTKIKKTYSINIPISNGGGIDVVEDGHLWNGELKRVKNFFYNNQCEKMTAFRKALLWIVEQLPKVPTVGDEVKAEIEGKIYKVKILEETK